MIHCNVCEYKDRCNERADEPLLSGCTSGHPVEFINPKSDWVHCPICGGKTRTKIREDTEAKNLIVFCPKCKKESVVNIYDGEVAKNENKTV